MVPPQLEYHVSPLGATELLITAIAIKIINKRSGIFCYCKELHQLQAVKSLPAKAACTWVSYSLKALLFFFLRVFPFGEKKSGQLTQSCYMWHAATYWRMSLGKQHNLQAQLSTCNEIQEKRGLYLHTKIKLISLVTIVIARKDHSIQELFLSLFLGHQLLIKIKNKIFF